MSNFEQCQTSEEIQKRVPKWKKLLSLKNSPATVLLEHSEGNEKIKSEKNDSRDDQLKTEKKRKKDESKDEAPKEERKKVKKDVRRKKKQKVNYEKKNDEKDSYRNESKNLSIQLPLENDETNDLNTVLVAEQAKLKISEAFTHTVKAGLNYLIIWRYHREKWKFQKTRQIWLLKNAYNEDLLSEDFFKLFLDYIAELLGQSRDRTLEIAQDIINKLGSEQKDDGTTDQIDEKRKEQIKLNRAKAIVRVLS
ncbi:hypothetical protein RclHR1_03110006 [Rhizophagus clarus]|uniref:WKF domain-containing protein n=1 Tax=Rhizophagus clarus TaxID=94130 RepID=A0A2Z6RIS9_9GLOM|nr:hypothetical protein RclHR1_03110006 [Rhizophagus clarus]GES88311.1 hypothetical protein GLOIN_2v389182 [Rhizophagus clarus]